MNLCLTLHMISADCYALCAPAILVSTSLTGVVSMRILLIEDDVKLCDSLTFQLEQEGFTVDLCHDGEDGLHWIRENAHELILLDRMLPGMNGIKVLEKMRAEKNSTPVILITALGELRDKVTGLDAGADDYIVKPFAFEELLARMRSINRRPKQWENVQEISAGDVILNVNERELHCKNNFCTLSKRETDLFRFILMNPNQILPRTLLLSRVWGPDAEVEDGNLDNYIHFLRRRLKTVNSRLTIKTIRGTGYRLEGTHV